MSDDFNLDHENALIIHLVLDERTVIRRSPEGAERAIAVYDLVEDNRFLPEEVDGPYHLYLGISENRMIFDVRGERRRPALRSCCRWRPFAGW